MQEKLRVKEQHLSWKKNVLLSARRVYTGI